MQEYEHPSESSQPHRFFQFGLAPDGKYRFRDSDLPSQVRLIGSGEIGGKARGLAFVMDHLEKGGELTQYQSFVHFPDSTIITTEIFDDFMRENQLAAAVESGCTGEVSLETLGDRIVDSPFPEQWRESLIAFLERETRPLAVRSSSVMEDNTDHSFAGIYLSDFLTNRGSMEQRLDELIHTVKRVYASTFCTNARAYRKRHKLDWRKEKMAILVQNMIGSQYSHRLFYPLVGGVAFSINYYPWTSRLKPEDGIVRLVVGTGTRAVGREYARVFSPKLPGLRPEGSVVRTIIRASQETVDVLDMDLGRLSQRKLNALSNPLLAKICSIVADDGTLRDPMSTAAMVKSDQRFVASFTRLIEGRTIMPFTPLVRETLASLEALLEYPIDIEFAVDFSSPAASRQGSPLFVILQVRPLGVRPEHREIPIPEIEQDRIIMECSHVLGNGQFASLRNLVFVNPETYRWDHAFDIARTIGRINRELDQKDEPYILIGPGRWASSNPQLGVPAQYNEISGAVVIVEMSTENLSPELSYGTHFYADMVASGVLYLPFHEEFDDLLNCGLLNQLPVAYQDPFVTHYRVPDGINVYVDGQNQRGILALAKPRV
ncbi:PEP/pyruvate-binding domain-containing protein [Candidatus Bipolaricaulota bacterium]|nr:PEP/pyruvate-binding domain-containing protein [Candidatus Bipolaricaulota bacterium]